jgi:hypothetical protein
VCASRPADTRRIEILDVAGRRIARVDADGTGHGEWAARPREGAALGAGLYFARPISADGRAGVATPLVITH